MNKEHQASAQNMLIDNSRIELGLKNHGVPKDEGG